MRVVVLVLACLIVFVHGDVRQCHCIMMHILMIICSMPGYLSGEHVYAEPTPFGWLLACAAC